MAETIHTGGLNTFVRPKGHYPKASSEFKMEIEEAYNRAQIRKEKERKKKILIFIIILILIFLALGVWWLINN